MDCGVNISLVDTAVLVSNTKNLLVEWGVGVTIDWLENPLQPFPTPWPAQPFWIFGYVLASIAAVTTLATRLLMSISANMVD